MSELKREVLILSLGNSSLCYFQLIGTIGIYQFSYYYHINQLFDQNEFIFYLILWFACGQYLGAETSSYFFQILGFQNGYLFCIFIHLLAGYLMFYQQKIQTVILSQFLMGIFQQLIYNGNNLFLSIKYDCGYTYSVYLHSAKMIFCIFYSYLSYIMSNPYNSPPIETKQGFKIPSQEVSENFFDFMFIYHLIAFLSLIFIAFQIKSPNQFNGRFKEFINCI